MGEVLSITARARFTIVPPVEPLALSQRLLAAYDLVSQAESPLRAPASDAGSGFYMIARAALMSIADRSAAVGHARDLLAELRGRA